MKTHFFKINFNYIVIALFLTVAGCSGCGYPGFRPEATQVEYTHFNDGTFGKLIKTEHGDTISFFRGGKSIKELFEMGMLSEEQLDLFAQEYKLDGCSESCEVYK